MTTKLLSPSESCKSIEVEGAITGAKKQYDMRSDGFFHVDSPKHVKALKAVGCTPGVTRMAGPGYRCQDCGFLAVFKNDPCGRCGATHLVEETQ